MFVSGLDVAVKKLKIETSLDSGTLQELRDEVDLLSSLRHPNIVQIIGASTRNRTNMFIVTEYLVSNSLALSHICFGECSC